MGGSSTSQQNRIDLPLSQAPGLWLHAVETYVQARPASQDFWAAHFGLHPDAAGDYRVGDITWRLRPGGAPCGTRGPHGALPVFGAESFGQARGYLRDRDIPIVFEEILPGLSLLIFLDPDANPIELAQPTDPRLWQIAERKAIRTHRRRDEAPPGPLHLGDLVELTIYTHDITASVPFYRDVLGLPVGLSFFGHIHLVAENLPVVLRATNWRCKTPQQFHGSEPVFATTALDALASRLDAAGFRMHAPHPHRLDVVDPVGVRVHFEQVIFAQI